MILNDIGEYTLTLGDCKSWKSYQEHQLSGVNIRCSTHFLALLIFLGGAHEPMPNADSDGVHIPDSL